MLMYFLGTIENESDKDYILWLYNEFEKLTIGKTNDSCIYSSNRR